MSRTILVCGGRDYADRERVAATLARYAERGDRIIHGAARGADTLAAAVAASMGCEVAGFPAQWQTFGRGAGAIRNQAMLDCERPALVIAFPGGPGTADMIRRARKAGVEVLEVTP